MTEYNFLGKTLYRLRTNPMVLAAMEDRADLAVFRERPSNRVLLGLTLLALSYVLCWPVVAVLSVVLGAIGKLLWLPVITPILWGLTHIMNMAGMVLAGSDSLRYGHAFSRWGARKLGEFLDARGFAVDAALERPLEQSSAEAE